MTRIKTGHARELRDETADPYLMAILGLTQELVSVHAWFANEGIVCARVLRRRIKSLSRSQA